MSKIVVTLDPAERDALVSLAVAEVRIPREQARHILRQESDRRGLLDGSDQQRQVLDDEAWLASSRPEQLG